MALVSTLRADSVFAAQYRSIRLVESRIGGAGAPGRVPHRVPPMNPYWTQLARRNWQVLLAVALFAGFTVVHAAAFRPALARYRSATAAGRPARHPARRHRAPRRRRRPRVRLPARRQLAHPRGRRGAGHLGRAHRRAARRGHPAGGEARARGALDRAGPGDAVARLRSWSARTSGCAGATRASSGCSTTSRARARSSPLDRFTIGADGVRGREHRDLGEPARPQAHGGAAMKLDPARLVGWLIALLLLVLVVQQTAGALHDSGVWARPPRTARATSPYAGLERTARRGPARDPRRRRCATRSRSAGPRRPRPRGPRRSGGRRRPSSPRAPSSPRSSGWRTTRARPSAGTGRTARCR